jgi:hypothetical protein
MVFPPRTNLSHYSSFSCNITYVVDGSQLYNPLRKLTNPEHSRIVRWLSESFPTITCLTVSYTATQKLDSLCDTCKILFLCSSAEITIFRGFPVSSSKPSNRSAEECCVFLRKFGMSPNYTASQPRRPCRSQLLS